MKIKVKDREKIGSNKVKKIRREGWVPGIIYGRGEESIPIKTEVKELQKLIKNLHSEATLITIDHEGEELQALLREVVRDPLTENLLHADFQHIHEDEEVTVHVMVELTGESEGVKEGGILDFVHRQLTVRCLPEDMPEKFVVDISELEIGNSIHIKDLELPEGVQLEEDPQDTIVNVLSPRKVVEVEPEETELLIGEEMEEPELISEEEEEGEVEEGTEEEPVETEE